MVIHSWMFLQPTCSTSTRIHYQGITTKGTATKESPPVNHHLRKKKDSIHSLLQPQRGRWKCITTQLLAVIRRVCGAFTLP
eukprot:12526407-Ditylum_brightwellii.AAC.2